MVTEVLTSPFPRAAKGPRGLGPPLAAEAWPLPGFVGSGVGSSSHGRSQGIGEGPQYYPLSPRQRRAHPCLSTGAGVAEPAISRWLHSPGSLEASYAGLGARAPMAKSSTPPATPPAHRVGSLREGLMRSSEPSRNGRLEPDPCRHVEADGTAGVAKISGLVSSTAQRDWPAMAWERVSVDEEKKELLRCLEASNQRNQELELERQGLKNSLERMEKLLLDLVGTQAAHGASVQSDAGRTYATWTPSVTPPRRMIPAELNPQGSPLRVRGAGASPRGLRHFSLSILDKSRRQDRYSFTRDMEHLGRGFSSPRRLWSYDTPSEALPTPPKLRAPMVHSGYGAGRLVTEPITAAADVVEARGVPRSLATSQSWMCRDRYNLVDICQNLPPRLKRW